ncbi:MAG TPA: hypothetical protein VGY56_08970, partial [Verrucomicrobiae bacterium]|nr:hypothetical protein [Verrucomicrobiae bacterium]
LKRRDSAELLNRNEDAFSRSPFLPLAQAQPGIQYGWNTHVYGYCCALISFCIVLMKPMTNEEAVLEVSGFTINDLTRCFEFNRENADCIVANIEG